MIDCFLFTDNSQYELAKVYYNRNAIITSTIDVLKSIGTESNRKELGPYGRLYTIY